MRCKNVRMQLLVQRPEAVIPPLISEHLASCEPCRQYLEQHRRLHHLLTLKTYERPPEGSEERMVRAVRHSLSGRWNPEPAEDVSRFWNIFFASPVPVFRYATAALLLLLVSAHMLNMPKLGPTDYPAGLQAHQTSSSGDVYMAEAIPVQPNETLLIAPEFQTVSNRGRGFMEYGPFQSVPARFDY